MNVSETIVWKDLKTEKPSDMEWCLVTVGVPDNTAVCMAIWSEKDQRFYYGVEEGETGIPSIYLWSWATRPVGMKFV